jgi:POT family proton-dependent oligopeptide transporter
MSIIVWVGIAITLATGVPVWLQMRHHPRGLKVLFFAEMWERFSYYGMRGLLIFYLTRHFMLDDAAANSQYGAYTSLVYLLPLIGGVLADRYLGTRKAIVFGALLLVAGHGLMAAEGDPARQYLVHQGARYEVVTGAAPKLVVNGAEYAYAPAPGGGIAIKGLPESAGLPQTLAPGSYSTVEERDPFFFGLFYLALAFIIMGVGFLKPNISTIVGQLYEENDPRRDPGFTLYYYGINLGAFWASVLCGLLGESVGWWAGFGLAGIGMLAGLIVFVRGKATLEGRGEPPDPARLAQKLVGPLTREHLIYLGGLVGLVFMWALVQRNEAVGLLLVFGSIISLGYVGWYIATQISGRARFDMILALILVAGAVVFFTLFEQAGSSLNLFADRNTRLPDGFSAAQTQSFNAGFILIFAPLFAMAWTWLAKRNLDPDPIIKFGLGLLQVGLGFLLLVWAAGTADADYRLPMIFLALAYLLHTTGELCLSPVGLSEITKLSVPALVSTMMAIWFLSSSWAQYLGAFIAEQAGTETIGGQVVDPRAALETSLGVFNAIGWVGVGSGVFFFLLSALLRRRSA